MGEAEALSEARGIQSRSLRWALFRKLKYVALNSAVAYLPLYLISSFAAYKNVVIHPRLFIFAAFLVLFLFIAGSVLDLIEYLVLKTTLGRYWRAAPAGIVCFARLLEFRDSGLRKKNCLIGKDEGGLFMFRRGTQTRLCAPPYSVSPHQRLGAYTPFVMRKVKLRPYVQIEGGMERYYVDVISPREMLERLAWKENGANEEET